MARPTTNPQTWATDTNFSAAGKGWDATPTKVDPTTLRAQGFAPDSEAAAQHVNYLEGQTADWLSFFREYDDALIFQSGYFFYDLRAKLKKPIAVTTTTTFDNLVCAAWTGSCWLLGGDLSSNEQLAISNVGSVGITATLAAIANADRVTAVWGDENVWLAGGRATGSVSTLGWRYVPGTDSLSWATVTFAGTYTSGDYVAAFLEIGSNITALINLGATVAAEYSSNLGTSWTAGTIGAVNVSLPGYGGLASDGTTAVVVDDSAAATSVYSTTDGQTFTARTVTSAGANGWRSVVYTPTYGWILFAYAGSVTPLESSNGLTWGAASTATNPVSSMSNYSVHAVGDFLVATVFAGTYYVYTYLSKDGGATWDLVFSEVSTIVTNTFVNGFEIARTYSNASVATSVFFF